MAKLLGKGVAGVTADVAIGDTAETGIMQSARVPVRVATCLVHIRAWGQWIAGAGATGITARIYRGGLADEGVVSEVAVLPRYGGAGAVETLMLEAVDWRRDAAAAEYSLTLEQVGASAAGSFLQGVLEVEVLSG